MNKAAKIFQEIPAIDRLRGRTLLIPRMSDEGATTFAAAFRSIGVAAMPVLPPNDRTLELGGRYTSGDECYPEKITLGDFLRGIEVLGADKVAFFMPTADGPCRFGQYAPYLRKVLRELGHEDVPVLAPTSTNSYDGIGQHAGELIRTSWRALLAADIIRKLRLRYRPYEIHKGDADQATEDALAETCAVLERRGIHQKQKLLELAAAMGRVAERFRAIRIRNERRPLIGVVGEIFCRLSTFSNEEVIRKIEEHGGECWLSDIAEWVWYTNREQIRKLTEAGKKYTLTMLKARLKNTIQQKEEHALYEPVRGLLKGREEPHSVAEILQRSLPYLPHYGTMGEMVLSVGKAVYLYEKGACGIAEISPFTCMNGIVCEAIYPRISADHDGIPIRTFYFDGTQKSVDQDVGIFMELAKNYMRKQARRQATRGRRETETR
ncbi:MAG: hypothetical protein AB1714_26495 [Acidobacteriota bacterium]